MTEAAENLGIGTSTLGKWVRKYRSGSGVKTVTGKTKYTPEAEELNELRKQIAKLKREREILKKALGYFAEEQR
jgi:transposase